MDLTPRLLTEVEFREQWRGYNPSDVDDFLERVAAAVGELQDRLREATERATQAERRLLDRSDDDEIRRTLVLAQRTAVTAVEEAQAEAERILEDANRHAREQVADAEARLAALEADIAERTRIELGELADRRAALQADVDALTRFQAEHRARLRAELERQLAELDAPTGPDAPLAVPDPPAVSEVDASVREPAVEIDIGPVTAPLPIVDAGSSRPPTEEEVAQAREDLLEALKRAGVDDLLTGETPPPAADAPVEAEVEVETEAEVEVEVDDDPVDDAVVEAAPPSPQLYDADADADDATAFPGEGELDALQWRDAAPEPATDEDDDPFLAELRRAVTDTEPLGPRDSDAVLPVPVEHDDGVPSGRFRLRRGR